MKNVFKILLVLAVILVSYFVGQHKDKEEYEGKIGELNKKIEFIETEKQTLEDRIKTLELDLMKIKDTQSKDKIKR